jgi:hypothetical protein
MAFRVITMELLGRGAHADPGAGCNVLELASVLAGESWSTRPPSVHPALAAVAGTVNDLLTDDRRPLITPLAPWLPGTSTREARVWPALASVCEQAAASISGQDQPRPLADAEARGARAGRRDRQWLDRALKSVRLAVAGSASRDGADAGLCQLLVDCVNECRWQDGEQAVDPRLPLADCPRRLAVRARVMWSPGCDWIEIGYEPVVSWPPSDCLTTVTGQRA